MIDIIKSPQCLYIGICFTPDGGVVQTNLTQSTKLHYVDRGYSTGMGNSFCVDKSVVCIARFTQPGDSSTGKNDDWQT